MVIGILQLIVYSGAAECAGHHESFPANRLPFTSTDWVMVNTIHSSLSIAWGIASRANQFLALDAMAARDVTLGDVILGGGSMRSRSSVPLHRLGRDMDDADDDGDGFTVGRPLVPEPEAESGAEGTAGFTMGQQLPRPRPPPPPPAVVALMRHSLRLDTEDPSADWPVRSLSPSRDCPTCPAWCVFERAGILIWNRHTSWAFHTHGLA